MLCCVCLEKTNEGIGIFDEMGKKLEIAKIVQQHLWIKPQPNDEYLAYICYTCWDALVQFHEFYEQVARAHDSHQLRKGTVIIKEEITHPTSSNIKIESDEILDPVHFDVEMNEDNVMDPNTSQKPLEYEQHNNLEFEGEIDAFLKQNMEVGVSNPLDDDDDDDVDDEDEENSDMDSEKGSEFDDYEPSDISSDEVKFIPNEKKKEKPKQTTSRKKTSIVSKSIGFEVMTTTEGTSDNVPKKKRTVYKLDPKHTEEMIRKHIPMGCCLCVYVGKTFSDIMEHFKDCHPQIKPYIMCCDRKLTKRFYVAQHALKHEDPNCFNCLECNKSFTTTCGLRAHNLNYHAPEEDRIYSCDQCPKKFAKTNLLEMHRTSHIPRDQWQYFCTICEPNKSFASEYLLNIHKSMQHKRAKHVCHVCAKEIRDKHSFEKHVRLHFEDSGPRLPCPYPDCESWLKDEDNLKQHLKRHNPEGVTYRCDECNKVCKNRRALTNHKRYAHSNETFQCEQCDKTFKKAISLREHMTQHTGETLYKCPFCIRTFNSNANMHAHKKRQHPIEWDEWRRNKKGSAQVLLTKLNPLSS